MNVDAETVEPKRHSKMNSNEQLLLSMKDGETQGNLKKVLQSYCLSVDTSGATRFHNCARDGNANVALFLLENGCQIDAQDSMGNTALIIAVEQNNKEVMEVLLAAGADIFILNHEGKSALHFLRANYEISTNTHKFFFREFRERCSTTEEVAERLIDAGIQLHLAVFTSDSKVIEHMLDHGSPLDSIHPLRQFTALHIAVLQNDLETVKLLLNRGADAKVLDVRNASPLYYLYKSDRTHNYRKVGILKILLECGVSPTDCGEEGRFDARYTLIEGSSEVICAMLQSGKLDFTIRDELYNRTVLHYLAQNSDPKVVDELEFHVDGGYDVNAVDRVGMTPLYWAAYCGNSEMLKFLLSKGASVDAGNHPRPPLYYAYTQSIPRYRGGCDRCVELLLENGADPQFVFLEPRDGLITVFDAAEKTSGFEGLKPAIAQLALMERSGVAVTEITGYEIGMNAKLDGYFEECRRVVGEEIFGNVTLWKLLKTKEKKIERYLRNGGFVRKMKQFNKRFKMRTRHSYLYNRWRRRYWKGTRYNRLRDGAARGVCKVLGWCVGEDHLIVDKVMGYLDTQSWRYLARL